MAVFERKPKTPAPPEKPVMFEKILIANRGEIALRIQDRKSTRLNSSHT